MNKGAGNDGNGLVRCCRRAGAVGAAIVVVSSIIGFLASFAWRTAMTPVIASIASERQSRWYADSLIVERLDNVSYRQVLISRALRFSLNDPRRNLALTLIDEDFQRQATGIRNPDRTK